MGKKILVTGGAGFIGSNLVEALLNDKRVDFVRVLDNLSTGFKHNIEFFFDNEKFEFIEGDIRDYSTCVKACEGIDLISHQAALGSVPRSIEAPLVTNAVNITGTLNVFTAAKELNVKRIVFAASSSTYGDNKALPKKEENIGRPLSPYAITKYVNELYAKVYSELYNLDYIGLRYFNIFGPKQDPSGGYAAVIPLFIKAAYEKKAPTINGDGSYSRDFTFVKNAIQANILSLFTTRSEALNQTYNIAFGERTSLNDLWRYIQENTNSNISAIYGSPRQGDVPHSLADISKAEKLLNYNPQYDVQDGLKQTCKWYLNKIKG
ncbi:MAG: SDR family oxidoreductase [Bacteroidetes bacterium]|nr:SDR family oxidoreductase [Bacteroidota bacterium]